MDQHLYMSTISVRPKGLPDGPQVNSLEACGVARLASGTCTHAIHFQPVIGSVQARHLPVKLRCNQSCFTKSPVSKPFQSSQLVTLDQCGCGGKIGICIGSFSCRQLECGDDTGVKIV